jgi:hypothetical protein
MKSKEIPHKLLLAHLKNNREALLQYSKLIGIAKHSVNLGTARECLIVNFIQKNLPEYISYHSGEIFDTKENRSGQIDIILHPITSPKINLQNTINIFPAETVLAAIEVKSNLTTGKRTGTLSEALVSCKKLKELDLFIPSHSEDSEQDITPSILADPNKIPFILFAYKGPQLNTLIKHLRTYCTNEDKYRVLPDLIVILESGYCLKKTKNWQYVGATFDNAYKVDQNKDFILLGIFVFILKLIEYWFIKPSKHIMPIDEYTKNMPSIFAFDINDL